jgi:hypothetical protein
MKLTKPEINKIAKIYANCVNLHYDGPESELISNDDLTKIRMCMNLDAWQALLKVGVHCEEYIPQTFDECVQFVLSKRKKK